LQLTDADDALDSSVDSTDGTVNLNTSLSTLSAMGIDSVVAATGSGVDAVNVLGYGSDTEITGLTFDSDLDVNLQLTDADDALDSSVDSTDGTVNLNTSLSTLSAMGIDSFEADADGSVDTVVISQGLGEITLSELSSLGLTFDDGLSVTVNFSDSDLTALGLSDPAAESSLMLGTGETAVALRDMGIDFITIDDATIELDDFS
jgi:hypothetical protein